MNLLPPQPPNMGPIQHHTGHIIYVSTFIGSHTESIEKSMNTQNSNSDVLVDSFHGYNKFKSDQPDV